MTDQPHTDQRNSAPPRVCPECGADRWKARDAVRTYERLRQKTRDVEKLARENGLLTYQLAEARQAVSEVQSRLQRKIVKQARVIRKFEERLREAKQKPYEGMGFDTAPAAEYDAGQILPDEEGSEFAS
jgi:vacuolar-type H+-ATPase subunit I/STV1